jgi:hypothetical protein
MKICSCGKAFNKAPFAFSAGAGIEGVETDTREHDASKNSLWCHQFSNGHGETDRRGTW